MRRSARLFVHLNAYSSCPKETILPSTPRIGNLHFFSATMASTSRTKLECEYFFSIGITVGQHARAIVTDVHKGMMDRFMGRMADNASVPQAQFVRCFGTDDPSSTLSARLRAFRRGLGGQSIKPSIIVGAPWGTSAVKPGGRGNVARAT